LSGERSAWFGACSRESDLRIESKLVELADDLGLVVSNVAHGQIAVVGLVSVPPLASIAVAHREQIVLVTAIAFGVRPSCFAWASAVILTADELVFTHKNCNRFVLMGQG
jgi:hypothetical protein